MNLPSIALWGFVATMILTTLMAGAQGLGLTRVGIPFIVGTIVTPHRARAGLVGFGLHLVNGWVFALLYGALFQNLRHGTWWMGAAFGAVHGLVVLIVLLPLLPGLHPRMASEHRGPEPTRALEPPGFLGLNYGRRTPLVIILAHVVYGAILGGFYRVAGV